MNVNYHLVWIPSRGGFILYLKKNREFIGKTRPYREVEKRLRQIIWDIASEREWNIIALEIMPDHVHLFINVPPNVAPHDVAKAIKGRGSRLLRQEFPHLLKLPSLWTHSYFVSTAGNVSSETIKIYIEEQRHHDTT